MSNTPSVKLPVQLQEVEIIDVEVEVDDQAQTFALGALSAADAAQALAAKDGPAKSMKDANGTQEIDVGDVLEVMQKPASSRTAPRPRTSPPPSEQVVSAIVVPPPPSAPQMVLPSVMVSRATPVPAPPAPADATMELVPGDVLEEVVLDAPRPAASAQPESIAPFAISIPAPAPSASDIAKTHVLPQTPRQPLARFSVDDEVAPFASDTVDIPLNRVAGMPVWLQIKDKPQVMIVGGAIAACFAIGVLALGIHLHGSSSDAAATANASAVGPTMHKEDPAAAIPPPPEQPDVQTVSIDDLKKDHAGAAAPAEASHPWSGATSGTPAAHAPSHAHAHHADAPAPAPKAHASSKPQGFGLVRTWLAAKGEPIAVDGKAVGVAPSPVRVSCGPHTIAIGHEIVKADVPCDGAITVGSPDHKK